MSAGHTPGPWVVCVDEDDGRAFTVFAEHQLVGECIDGGAWDNYVARAGLNHDNYEENARLIAAAPELLQALQAMASSFHAVEWMDGHMRESAEMARAAITKATGGSA